MQTVVLTIHTLIVIALIGVVLLQRSEGGALGMGGGGGGGGFMTGRGAANALTRTTSILAALFFATSLGLAFFASSGEREETIIEELTGEEVRDPNAPLSADDLRRTLGSDRDAPEESPLDADPEAALEEALESMGVGAADDAAPEDAAPEDAGETDPPETPER